jgi:GntR family transcriptional regulator/MocR family aminotransferase
MDVHVTLEGRGDLSARIYRQLLDAIVDGRLRPGQRLPPTRELARRLAVSRNTVAVAYERLAAEGVLTGRVGAGRFVCVEAIRSVRARHAPAGIGVHPRFAVEDPLGTRHSRPIECAPLRLSRGLPRRTIVPVYDVAATGGS